MSKNKMLGNQVVVTKNNDGEAVKMEKTNINKELIVNGLKDRKPYAFRISVPLRMAIDRVSGNASEFITELLLKDERIKNAFLDIISKGYDKDTKVRKETDVEHLFNYF